MSGLEAEVRVGRAGARSWATGPASRAARRFVRRPAGVAALLLLLVVFGAGQLAPQVAPYDPTSLDLQHMFAAPTLAGRHFFGTDIAGRDYFSRTLYALRTSERLALWVAVAATLLGIVVGGVAGYYRRWADGILMRLVDFVTSFPALAVLFTAVILLGAPTPQKLRLVLAGYLWAPVARLVRGSFFSLREREFVEAARASGASDLRIVVRHLLPNTAGAIVVAATTTIGQVILLEATVEFFYYGVDQNRTPTLGNLVADGTKLGSDFYFGGGHGIASYWWLWAMPAAVIVLLLVCVNVVGDALDEVLNPVSAR